MTPALINAAALAPLHPALRVTPVWRPDVRAQHLRHPNGGTLCGLEGPLTIAETTDARCTSGCWDNTCGNPGR